MTAKKPSELARAKLTRRAKEMIALSNNTVPKRLQKTPSQKRSEAIRKRYLNRAGVQEIKVEIPEDCHGCQKYPCGIKLEACHERSMVHRCLGCGLKVRHRIVPGDPWMYCPVCKVKRE